MFRRNIHVLLTLVWFAAFAAAAVAVFHLKLQDLRFHTRDFPFYAGNFARLFSADLSRELAVNPDGYNVFGFRGLDAYPNVYFDIHISAIKFALAWIYTITGSLYAVFGVFWTVFLLSIAYLIRAYWTPAHRDQIIVLIGASALVLNPAAYDFLTFDVRAYILILPFLFMLVAALDRRRPGWEIASIAVFGLLIREEAVIFILFAAIYLHFDGRVRVARVLFVLATAFAASAYAYYALFTEFEYLTRVGPAKQLALLLIVVSYLGLELLPRFRLLDWAGGLFRQLRPFTLVVFGAPFGLEFIARSGPYIKTMNFKALAAELTTSEPWYPGIALAVIAAMSVCLVVWPRLRLVARLAIGSIVASVLLLMAVMNVRFLVVLYEQGTPRQFVWRVAEHLRTLPGTVVVDYGMHQAFFDRDNVVVWERLPSSLATGDERYFPLSRTALTGVLAERAAYFVVTERSLGPLFALAGDAGVIDDVETCIAAAGVIVARRVSLSRPCADLGLAAGPVDDPVVRAEMRLAAGRYDEAIADLEQVVASGTGDAASLTALGRSYVLGGQPGEGVRALMWAAEQSGLPSPEQIYLVALANYVDERYVSSAALLQTAIASDPEDYTARALLVATYGMLGRVADAGRVLNDLNLALRRNGRLFFSTDEAENFPRYRRPEDLARYLDGLRRAEVPNSTSR